MGSNVTDMLVVVVGDVKKLALAFSPINSDF